MRRALAFVLLTSIPMGHAPALAAPPAPVLGPADRAAAQNVLLALKADPFADQPLAELERIYQRGPGSAALYADFNERGLRAGASGADLIVLGRLELARGHKADGLRALGRAVALTDDPDRLRRLGRLLDENGDRVDAIQAYQRGRAGATPIELRGVLVRLGALLLAEGKTADARAVWDEAKRLTPNDQTLRRQISEALAARGAFREALTELQEIEPIVAKEPLAMLTVLRREAEFARRAGNRRLCTEVLVRAYVITTEMHSSALRAGDHPRAAPPVQIGPHGRGGAATEGAGRAPGAAPGARAQGPGGRGLDRRCPGGARRHGARHRGAAARGAGANRGDPYLLRRLCALETGEERLRNLASLFEAERNDASIGLDLIVALFEAKQPGKAVERARALRARFPDSAPLLMEMSRLLSRNGQHAEALVLQERILQLEPDFPEAQLAYADELRAAGRAAEASKAYFRLVAKDGSLASYRHLIDLLVQRNLTGDLKRAYTEALAKSPDDVALHRDYARWLVSSGANDEGLAQWKIVQAKSKDSDFLRDYAKRENPSTRDAEDVEPLGSTRMKRYVLALCFLSLLSAVPACKNGGAPSVAAGKTVNVAPLAPPQASPPAGAKLPPLIDKAGLAALLASHKGKPVLINVFASWCTPCKRELPDLAQLAAQHPRFVLIGIDVDQKDEDLKQFLPNVPKTMIVYRRPDGFESLLPALDLPKDWNEAVPPGWAATLPLTLAFEKTGEFGTGSVGQLSAEAMEEIGKLDAAPAAK